MENEPLTLDIPFQPQPHRLTCYQWGNKTAETILCVHGLTRNGRDFDFLAARLAEKYRVLAPDMPGRGKSDWLAPALYNYQTYIFDIQQLLQNQNITSVHWVGTSMGGIIGLMMASAMPGLIKSLVLNDLGCVISSAGLKRILSYAGVSAIFNTRAEVEMELRKRCEPFGIHDEMHWQHLFTHGVRETADGKYTFHYDPAIVAGLVTAEQIQDINLWPLWDAVKSIPVLLIRGTESDLLTRETALQMQATHSRLTYVEIPNTGHAPALMDLESIEKIKAWIP